MNNLAQQLADLERTLNLRVPAAYRALLLDYPPRVRAVVYNADTDPPEGPANWELLADLKRILELNAEERRLRAECEVSQIPPSYLLIGHDGCGDLYAVDTNLADECPVFGYDHEMEEDPSSETWSRCADSLKEFCEILMNVGED